MRILILSLAIGILVACSADKTPTSEQTALQSDKQKPILIGDPIEGLRVASRVGCNGCHGKDAGGQVFFESEEEGLIVAPNLTKQRHLYNDTQLERLLRGGITHDGHRPLGMPVFMFQYLSDREIRDINAWLRSIPDIANPDLPEKRWSEKLLLQLKNGSYPYDDDLPDPNIQSPSIPPTEQLALGKHIAYSSCTECHGRELNGWGPDDDTPSLIVAKAYTPDLFARLMKTGITANGEESKSGLMTKMGRMRFSVLTEQEVSALKAYLDSR